MARHFRQKSHHFHHGLVLFTFRRRSILSKKSKKQEAIEEKNVPTTRYVRSAKVPSPLITQTMAAAVKKPHSPRIIKPKSLGPETSATSLAASKLLAQ